MRHLAVIFYACFLTLAVDGTRSAMAVEPQVAAGFEHTVLLDADGTVWAAGANDSGQLGNNTLSPSGSAAQVQYVNETSISNFIAVAVGTNHSVALRADGTVWAWGANDAGQLGNNIDYASVLYAGQVVDMGGAALSQIIAISAGADFSLALRADGTVWAWGSDARGQLGNDAVGSGSLNYAVQVNGLGNVVQIEAGNLHSLARLVDGRVWAWGYNRFGQLGDYTTITAFVPVPVTGIYDAIDIAAGNHHSLCVLAAEGKVKSWGYDFNGQLGRNTTLGDSGANMEPKYMLLSDDTPVEGIKNVAAGGRNGDHSLLLSYSGQPYACGQGSLGQLGNNSVSDLSAVTAVSDLKRVRSIAAGSTHSMFMKADGTVWYLGDNGAGQSMAGSIGGSVAEPALCYASWSMVGMMAVSAGNSHTMYLKADGTVWVSGSNDYFQLSGTGPSVSVLQQVTDTNIYDIIAISAGAYHSMALRADGRVYCWGRNDKGAVGNGLALPAANVSAPYLAMTRAKAIAAGGSTSYALYYLGHVSAWGENTNYQLSRADGSATNRNSADWVCTDSYGYYLYPMVDIDAGGTHAMALNAYGRVVVWGSNSSGQYGDGSTSTATYATQAADIDQIKGFAAGRQHSLFLNASGFVFATGDYNYGQLGNGSIGPGVFPFFTTLVKSPVAVSLTQLAKQVAAGGEQGDCSGALLATGRAMTWGSGGSGQLGNNGLSDSASPVQVAGGIKIVPTPLVNIVALATGDTHMAAVISTGAIRTWGENSHGELANNNVPTDAKIGVHPTATWLPVVSVSAPVSSASEAPSPISGTFRVTRTLLTPGKLNVTLFMGGDASVSDYIPLPVTVAIEPGTTSVDVTLTPTDDFVAEGSETAILTVSNGNLYLGADAPANAASVSISDNDVAGITRSGVSGALSEAGGAATFTLVLNSQPTADVQITMSVSDTTPNTNEATINPPAVTFTPADWFTPKIITVTGNDDAIDDGDQLVTVTINNSTSLDSNYNRPPNPQTNPILSNQDNDTRGISLLPTPITVSEDGLTRVLTVALTTQPTADVTVTLTRNTAQIGLAGVSASNTLSFTPGNFATGQAVTVSAVDDNLDEASPSDYQITSTCTGGDYTGTTGAPVTVSVTDNDNPPTLAITSAVVTEGGNVVVTVNMTGRSASAVTVNYATGLGGTAQGGSTTVAAAMDAVQTSCTVASATGISIGMVMLVESEQLVVTAVAGNVLTVARAHGGSIAAPHAIGGAVQGGDFVATAGLLTWPADTVGAQTFIVQTIDDVLDENNEDIPVSLSTPVNATITTSTSTVTITDNDATPTVQFTDGAGAPLAAQSVAEPASDTAVALSLTLSAVSGRDVKVFFGSGGSAALGSDWTSPSSPLTIPAGTRTASIGTLTVKSDNIHEGAETVVITLAAPTNATVGVTNIHTLTITPDADAPPTVTLSSLDLIAEGESGVLTVTVTKSHASELPVTIPFLLTGSATVVADYTTIASPLILAAGSVTGSIPFTIVNDTINEVNEGFTITMGTPINATVGATTTLNATIEDNDAVPTVAFTVASANVGEAAPSATITAQLSSVSGKIIQVPYTVSVAVSNPATRNTDFTLSPQAPDTITIPAGSISASLTLSPVNDDLDEVDEVARIVMGTAVNATAAGIVQHDLTITDDDATPTIAVTPASISENGGSASMSVTLTGKSASTVSVNYATFAGTTLSAAVTNIASTLSVVSAAGIAPNVEIQVEAERMLVTGVSGTVLTVTRAIRSTVAAAHANAVAVTGTAAPVSDFTAASGLLTWNPGETGSKTVNVLINDDLDTEGVEVTGLGVLLPVGATIPPAGAAAALTIIDDDSPGVRLSASIVAVTEGGVTATYGIRLNTNPSANGVVVRVTPDAQLEVSLDGSVWAASRDLTFNQTGQPSPFDTAQTIHVRAKDDSVYELSHAATITHAISVSPAAEYPLSMEIGGVAATITDNEAAPIVTINATASANETAGTITFTASIDRASTFTTSATFATTDGTAIAGADYSAALGTVSWVPGNTTGQLINITILSDTFDEDDETLSVAVSAPVNATMGAPATGTATIVDDPADLPPAVAFTSATATGIENVAVTAPTAIISTLQLSGASGKTVSVPFTLSGTATIGSDATVTASPVVFLPGEMSKQIGIVTIDDALVENGETVVATIGIPTNATVGTTGVCTATITDDDTGTLIITESVGSTAVTEAGLTDTYAVVLSKQPGSDVVVVVTPDAQLRVDTDPSVVGDQSTLTFTTANWDQSQFVTVFAVDDAVQEVTPLSVTIAHAVSSGPAGYATAAVNLAGISVTDNDTASIVVTSSGTVTAEDSTAITVTVVLGSKPSANVDLTFASTDSTEGASSPATLMFTPANWDTAQNVVVTGAQDAIDDGDIAYALRCTVKTTTDAFYTALAVPADVALVNRDDDVRGVTVVPTSTLLTTEAGGQAVCVVVLRSQPDNSTTVRIPLDIAPGGTGEAMLDRAFVDFNATNWSVPQVVTVTGKDDSIDDGNVGFTVRLLPMIVQGGPANDYTLPALDPEDLSGINNDNDTAQVLVTVGTAIAINEAQTVTGSYQVSLATQPTATVTVTAQADSQCEISLDGTTWAVQRVVTFGTGIGIGGWNTNQTIQVRAKDDAIAEGDHALTIRQSATGTLGDAYNGLAVASVSGTVTDNDLSGYTLVAATTPLTTTEAGGQDSFTIKLKSQPTANVVVLLSSSDSTEGSVGQSSVSFSPGDWATARAVTVTGLDDRLVDGTQTYQVVTAQALSNDLVYNGSDPADVSVTNSDDDSSGISVNVIGSQTTEAGGSVSLQVSLTSQPTASVVVSLNSSVTAEGALPAQPTVLTFTTANWSTTQTVAVTGVDDSRVDGSQAYQVAFLPSTSTDPNYNNITPLSQALTNTDNDVAGITVTPARAPTLLTSEGGVSDTFTVRLTSQPSATVTIPVATLDATEFSVSTANVVFDSVTWNTPQTVTVTGVNDNIVDGVITAVVSLGAATSTDVIYSGIDPVDVTVSNADNDVASVGFSPASGLAVTEGGGSVSYSAVLTAQPTGTVTITLNPGSQLSVTPATLVFTTGNWAVAQNVSVSAVNDSLAEGSHNGTMTHTIAGGGFDAVVVPNQAIAITDNDTAGVSITGSPVVVSESGTSATVIVVLTSQPTAQVSVNMTSTQVGEAVVSPSSLLFTTADWNVPRTVTITGVDESVDDGDQAVSISIPVPITADITYAAIDPTDIGVTVTDNDTRAVIIAPSAVVVNEQGASAAVQVRLASQPTATVTIGAVTSNAAEAVVLPASLSFTTSNWAQPQSLTVSGVNDIVADGDQAFQIQFTVSGGDYAGQLMTPVSGVNQDDDQAAVLVAQTGGGTEVTEGGATDSVAVSLTTAPIGGQVTVALNGGSQLGLGSPVLVFTAANFAIPQTVSITAVDDAVAEGSHSGTLGFTASGADYGTVTIPALSITIADNDNAAVNVSTQSGLVTDEGGRSASFLVTLGSQPTANVTIAVSSSNLAEGTVAPASLTFTAANWSQAQSVTLTGVNDQVADGDRPYVVVLAQVVSADPRYAAINPADVSASNSDDDTVGISVSPSSGLVVAEGGTAAVSIVLRSQPISDVIIDLNSSQPAQATVPASVTISAALWNQPVSVTVTGVQELIVDGDQAFTIVTAVRAGTDPAYAAINPADVTGIVVDDDQARVLVQSSGLVVAEPGTQATFAVRLSVPPLPGEIVTVDLSTAGGQVGLDVPQLLFTDGTYGTAQVVTVTALNDAIAEGEHAATITGAVSSAPGGGVYAVTTMLPLPVTIRDDDLAGVTISQTAGLITTEVGGTATFTVALSSQPTQDVVINLASTDAGQGGVSPAQVVFSTTNWSTGQTVTITGADGNGREDGDVLYQILTTMRTSGTVDPRYAAIDPADVCVVNRTASNPPVCGVSPTLALNEDGGAQSVTLTDVSNGQPLSETGTVVITAVADDPLLVSNLVVAYSHPATTGTIQFIPGTNRYGTADITVTATDSDGTTPLIRHIMVTVAAVNDLPVLSTPVAAVAVDRNATIAITPVMLSATDVESASAALVFTVSLRPSQGDLQVLRGVWTSLINGATFTQAEIATGLRYVHGNGTGTTDGFALTVGDGTDSSAVGVVNLAINVGLTQPVITISGATPTWSEGNGPGGGGTGGTGAVQIAANATVVDADFLPAQGFLSGSLTVTVAGGVVGTASQERISIRNQGAAAGQIGVTGTSVTYGGTAIGAISSDGVGQALVVTFNLAASEAAVGALIANVQYDFVGDNPGSNRTISLAIDDGRGGVLQAATTQVVNIVPVNDAPTLAAVSFSTAQGIAVLGNVLPTDPEGSTMTVTAGVTLLGTFTFVTGPVGSFSYAPTAGRSGTETIQVTVSDGVASVIVPVTLRIVGGSDGRPWITSDPPLEIHVGGEIRYAVLADGSTCAPGTTLVWTLENAPTGMTIASTGALTAAVVWAPVPATGLGYQTVRIIARDPIGGGVAVQEITIKVSAVPAGGA